MKKYVYLALGFSMFTLAACDHAHYTPKALAGVNVKTDAKNSAKDLQGIDSADAKASGQSTFANQCQSTIQATSTADEKTVSLKQLKGTLDLQKVTLFSENLTTQSQIEGSWSLEGGAGVSCHNSYSNKSGSTQFKTRMTVPYHIDAKGGVTMAALALQAKSGNVAAQFTPDAKPTVKTADLEANPKGDEKAIFVTKNDGSVIWRIENTVKDKEGNQVHFIVEAAYGSIDQAQPMADDTAKTTTAQAKPASGK